MLSRFRHVIGELHPEKVIHIRAERLFDAQRHFRCQRGLAVQQVGERGPACHAAAVVLRVGKEGEGGGRIQRGTPRY